MFSRRVPSRLEPNALARAVAAARGSGTPIADLTESNPTRVGIPYPEGLLAPLADPASLRYEPCPFGLPAARAAVALDQRRRGVEVDPADIILTSSTSEAYSWLFKLLCNPGEAVAVPSPSYPLFEHLTALDGVHAQPYPLECHGRWLLDMAALAAAPATVRALLVVSPNNPTGSFVAAGELSRLVELCVERGWALIADEVFADYPLDADAPLTDIAARAGVLAFSLAGLSKTVGLPQLKAAWMVAGGPAADRAAALARLELIADTYLPVATPVQVAMPSLLESGAVVRGAIQERTRQNLAALRTIARTFPACSVLRAEGGWSAVVRVPSTRSEEALVLDLIQRERVLVHPGYFFDFPAESFVVVSLLPEPRLFADAVQRLLRFVSS